MTVRLRAIDAALSLGLWANTGSAASLASSISVYQASGELLVRIVVVGARVEARDAVMVECRSMSYEMSHDVIRNVVRNYMFSGLPVVRPTSSDTTDRRATSVKNHPDVDGGRALQDRPAESLKQVGARFGHARARDLPAGVKGKMTESAQRRAGTVRVSTGRSP